MTTKYCVHCNKEKPLVKGSWRWSSTKGCFGTMCLDCFREVGRLARQKYRATEKGLVNSRKSNRQCMAKLLATPEGQEQNRKSSLDWARRNKDKVAAQTRRYRAAKQRRVPLWADHKAINEIYAKAQQSTGATLAVDHVIPLNGELVSGLHVANNLQLLTKEENTSKSNNFDPKTSGFSFKELRAQFLELDLQVQNG